MKMMKKNNSKLKIVKPSRIIFLIVLIAANSLAWFIYATKITGDISVHVKAWNIVFESGQTQLTNNINLHVDSIYPGMSNYNYNITIYNNSEVSASISYSILEARILNDTYVTTEGRLERGELIQSTDLTSAALLSKLASDYPFTISFNLSDLNIDEGDGREDFSFNVVWPYENNQDDLDTQWGIAAHNFKQSNPSLETIEIIVKIYITQNPN